MNEDYKGVWVFVEQNAENGVASVSLELLGAGRQLADKLEVPLSGVLLGSNVENLTTSLFEHGADSVYLMDDPLLEKYRTEAFMYGVIDLVEKYKPEIFLFGATPNGKDLASAIATDLSTGLTADTTMLDVDVEKRLLEASRPAFGGNIMATILCKKTRPQMATVRPKVMKALDPEEGRTGDVIKEAYSIGDKQIHTKVLEIIREAKAANLDDADIIVCGGKGMGDEKGFQLIYELADAIGATPGGTRDVVEAGWIDHDHQIGQTGVTVTPKLYFAIGVSGAIQHVVGMKNSDLIISINKDPDAPIFDVSHYGIVGDALEIVPMLIEAFRKELATEKGVAVNV